MGGFEFDGWRDLRVEEGGGGGGGGVMVVVGYIVYVVMS